MKEKVAVATVQGKAYFLIVNALRENNIPFISVVPGESVPTRVKLMITTEKEQSKVQFEKVRVFHDETQIENLISETKALLLGKEAFERIIIGIDPGEAIGVAVVADGKVIEEENCYSIHELVNKILKVLRTVNFSITKVIVKIGNGVPVYRELLRDLDAALPDQVTIEVVGEAGTNKPLKENRRSRKIRHISSAIRIAGRIGQVYTRRERVAEDSSSQ